MAKKIETDEHRWVKAKIIIFLSKAGAYIINSVLITLILAIVAGALWSLYLAITA